MTPFPRAAYRPLARYAPDRRPVELDLSDNTSRWGAHPDALRVLREAMDGPHPEALLRYPPVYADRLARAVADRFGVSEAAVTTGCGSDDLLDSAFRAACEPGEGVRFLPPTFSMIEIFARMNGLDPMPLLREGAPDPSPLPHPDRLLEGGPGLIYLCRPNNPTGEVQPREWVEGLVRAAGPAGPVILIDEAYADFMEPRRGGPDSPRARAPGIDDAPDSFVAEAAASGRVVVLRTLSKAYGLAGLRVGFAVGAPEVIREIEKSRGPYKVSRPGEAAGVAALQDRANWVRGIVDEIRTERDRLAGELERRGLPPLPSGANFLCVPLGPPKARGSERARFAIDPTASGVTAALRERGVAVRPFPGLPGIGEAIRVSIGPRLDMDRFLQALDGILR